MSATTLIRIDDSIAMYLTDAVAVAEAVFGDVLTIAERYELGRVHEQLCAAEARHHDSARRTGA